MSPRTLQMTHTLHDYYATVAYREPPALADLREETHAKLGGRAEMQIAPDQGQLMALLVKLTGAKRLLEVGTFTGYSALACALALPPDGRIVCCDVSEEWTAIARRHWATAGVADRIDLHLGPAVDTLDRLLADGAAGTFDQCFIDADKTGYDAYYERALRLLRPGGLVLIDNVLWNGSIADPMDTRPDTLALRALNAKIHADPRVDLCLLPIGDGLTLARVR